MTKHAIGFMTHIWNAHIDERARKLRDELPEGHELFVVADCTSGTISEADMPPGVRFHGFTHGVVSKYKPASSLLPNLVPGNVDEAILDFCSAYPEFDHYWKVENDVVFSGNWRTFFDAFAFSDVDLLATTVCRRTGLPDWPLWRSLEMPEDVPPENQLRVFIPLCRLSRRAAETLIREYPKGWKGHYECTMPTAIYANGLSVEDIGGSGEFTQAENINRFYWNTPENPQLTPGSFVFKPVMEGPGDKPDTLWHPVKWPQARPWYKPRTSPLQKLKAWYWTLRA